MRNMCCAWDRLPAGTHRSKTKSSSPSAVVAAAATTIASAIMPQRYDEQLELTSSPNRMATKTTSRSYQQQSQPHLHQRHPNRHHRHHHYHQQQQQHYDPHKQRQYYYHHNGLQYSYQQYGVGAGGAGGVKALSICRKRKLLHFFKKDNIVIHLNCSLKEKETCLVMLLR
ncbi:unnamed protein product [Ceratitis capitata]|uniref:(Mediterranean fruit fly) hypothetical protein n=1 Tax=Ceratitis capitata TaxID=7213 RepID=A0A811UWE3_CERCA|nr:unnamed protein product [Ceratitis capitata]